MIAVWIPTMIRLAMNGAVTGCEFTPYLPFVLIAAILLPGLPAILVALAAVPIEVEPDPARMRPADIAAIAGDPSRLRAATGWEPAIPLEQTLRDALDAARSAATIGRMPG
jgi:hypothetical protein